MKKFFKNKGDIKELRKNQILEAALKLFARDSYENTTIENISKYCGISKGLVYNYFDSKENLLENVLNFGLEKILKDFDPDKNGVLEVEEMKYFLERITEILIENRDFYKLYFQISLQKQGSEVIKKLINRISKTFERELINYFKTNNFEEPVVEAKLFISLLDGITFNFVITQDDKFLMKVKNELIKRYCKKINH